MIFEDLQTIVFVWIVSSDGKIVTVTREYKGVRYVGLPSGIPGNLESCHDCGLRILDWYTTHTQIKHKGVTVSWTEGVWDERKSNLNVLIFQGVNVLSLLNNATWANPLDNDILFDVSVRLHLPNILRTPPPMSLHMAV